MEKKSVNSNADESMTLQLYRGRDISLCLHKCIVPNGLRLNGDMRIGKNVKDNTNAL